MQFSDNTKQSFKTVIYLIAASIVWSIFCLLLDFTTKAPVIYALSQVTQAFFTLGIVFFMFKTIYMAVRDSLVGLIQPKLKKENEVIHKSKHNDAVSDYPDVDNSDIYYFDDNNESRVNHPKTAVS